MSEVQPNTGEVGSLGVARAKIASVIEIYSPMTGRAAVLETWGHALIEFEAAVREDERTKNVEAVPVGLPNVVGDHTSPAAREQEHTVDSEAMAANLTEAQADGTSGDIALGRDKEAMKAERKRK